MPATRDCQIAKTSWEGRIKLEVSCPDFKLYNNNIVHYWHKDQWNRTENLEINLYI